MPKRVRCVIGAWIFVLVAVVFCVAGAEAGQIGHYMPDVLNIRDLVVAPKGFYAADYSPYYSSDGSYKGNEKVKTIQAGRMIQLPSGGQIEITATADVNLSVTSYGSSPTFIWSTGEQFLGADYQFILAPYIGYQKVKFEGEVTLGGPGIILPGDIARASVSKEDTSSGFGDLYVQPVMLGWHQEKWDFSLYYGFYAPTGEYDKSSLANVGYGFWSHELNFATYYYVDKQKATALFLDMNYEYNTRKEGSDVTPGQNVGFVYGISQYLSEQLEVGINGASLFKVTGDTGSDVRNKEASDYTHSAGAQLSYWIIKHKLNLSGRCSWEYAASGRTKGTLASLNVVYAF
jgi:hypothetical protein